MKKINLLKRFPAAALVIFFASLFFSCTGTTEKKQKGQANIPEKVLSKPPSSYTDTLVINVASAVFYNPDSLQLEKIRSVNERPIFESMTHDCFYQMRNARAVLKKYWPQVKIVETSKARFLLFVKDDESKPCIDLDSKNDMCGIFLFTPKKRPVLIDMMNIDTALEDYFNN